MEANDKPTWVWAGAFGPIALPAGSTVPLYYVRHSDDTYSVAEPQPPRFAPPAVAGHNSAEPFAGAKDALAAARAIVSYAASGMTHSSDMTNLAKQALEQIDAALAASPLPPAAPPTSVIDKSDEEILSHFSKYWEHQWHDGSAQVCRFRKNELVDAVRALAGQVAPQAIDNNNIKEEIIDVFRSCGFEVHENNEFDPRSPPMVYGPLDSGAILIDALIDVFGGHEGASTKAPKTTVMSPSSRMNPSMPMDFPDAQLDEGGLPCPDCSVPQDVLRALDRMCTPLHPTVMKGVTAIEDAHCMKVIRDYILATPPASKATEQNNTALIAHVVQHIRDYGVFRYRAGCSVKQHEDLIQQAENKLSINKDMLALFPSSAASKADTGEIHNAALNRAFDEGVRFGEEYALEKAAKAVWQFRSAENISPALMQNISLICALIRALKPAAPSSIKAEPKVSETRSFWSFRWHDTGEVNFQTMFANREAAQQYIDQFGTDTIATAVELIIKAEPTGDQL